VSWKNLRNVDSVHLIAPDQLNTYDVLVSDDVVFTEGALAAFLNKPGTPEGKALGDAVDTLAAESAPAGGRRTSTPTKAAAPAKAAAPKPEETAVSETPATDAGTTAPAGEGVSDAEAAAEVAEQTSPDLKAEEAFETAAGKDTDAPAETALANETPDAPAGGDA
jgi:hypothetical protein